MSKEIIQSLVKHPIQTIMVCALACEAKPLIDLFKLKKDTRIHAFSVYQSGSMVLMVSGMGQSNMSAAVNWLSGFLHPNQSQFWFNMGVAGHPSADVGHLFCAHKISDQQHVLYPTKWLRHKVMLEPLITVNHEEILYQDNALYDMEGFAFYQAAVRFNSQECVQCLKVVADNKEHAVSRDKAFISNLIAAQCDAIVSFIALHLEALKKHKPNNPIFEGLQLQLMDALHFSHSQQLQLAKLCQAAQSHAINLERLDFSQASQAKAALLMIKQHLDSHAVSL